MLNKQELERMRTHMPEREYRQEILAEFVTGEGAVFRDVTAVATAAAEFEGARGVAYVIGVDLARRGNIRLIDRGEGIVDAYLARTSAGRRTDRYRNHDIGDHE